MNEIKRGWLNLRAKNARQERERLRFMITCERLDNLGYSLDDLAHAAKQVANIDLNIFNMGEQA